MPNTSETLSVMKVKIPAILHDQVRFYAENALLTQGQVVEIILSGYFNETTSADTLKQIMRIQVQD